MSKEDLNFGGGTSPSNISVGNLDSFLKDSDKPNGGGETLVDEVAPISKEKEEEVQLEDFLPKEDIGKEELDENGKPIIVKPKGTEKPKEKEEDNKGNSIFNEENDLETPKTEINYRNIVSKLIEDKIWEGIDSLEDENGNEVPFDEVEIDEELFYDLVKQQEAFKKEELLKDKIDGSNMSDIAKRLVEIDKKGGNVTQILETFKNVKNPLDNLDLETEAGQEAALVMKYRAMNLSDKEIAPILSGLKASDKLQDEAYKAKEDIENAITAQMDKIEKDAEDRQKASQEALKTYRKELKTSLDSYTLKDSYKRKLVDIATKPDDKGNFELDRIYSEIRKDPKKASELALYLTDRESFVKIVTNDMKREVQIDTMKKFKMVNRGKSKINLGGNSGSGKEKSIDLSKINS